MGGTRIGAGTQHSRIGWVARRGSELGGPQIRWVAQYPQIRRPAEACNAAATPKRAHSAGWRAEIGAGAATQIHPVASWGLTGLDGWQGLAGLNEWQGPTQRLPGPDTESSGPRHTERGAPTQRVPGPDTESAWAPTQRVPGPDTESTGPRHRDRRGPTKRTEKTAGPRHRPRQRAPEPDAAPTQRAPGPDLLLRAFAIQVLLIKCW